MTLAIFTHNPMSHLSASTQAKYRAALDKMREAGVNPADFDRLAMYAAPLSISHRAHLKAALKAVCEDELARLKSQATPDNISVIQALEARLSSIDHAIRVPKQKGEKSHLWLTPEQVQELTALPDRTTVQGRRDWVILALLLSGLRREEAATITFDRVNRRPMSDGQMRTVLDVTGKGAKDRTVPINSVIEERLREWRNEAGEGNVARAVNKAGRINGSLSPQAVYDIVAYYGVQIGLPELRPHDLRRTYAMIGWSNTHDLMLVMTLLGHSDPETTKRYLNLKVNLDQTISDFVPLS